MLGLLVKRWYVWRKLLLGTVSVCLVGSQCSCGGHDSALPPPVQQENAKAEKVVGLTNLDDLSHCLSDLSAQLRAKPGRTDLNLYCAVGSYVGALSDGRPCRLKVDDGTSKFELQMGTDRITIAWNTLVFGADGKPSSNLEDSSAAGQPGIQLTQFTGGLVPVTEALILRAGSRPQVLPQMMYQRTEASNTKYLVCRFGK